MAADDDKPRLRPVVVPIRSTDDEREEDEPSACRQELDDDVTNAERVLALALVRRAEALSHKDEAGARDDLDRAIGLDPNGGEPWFALAVMERWDDEALALIDEALARDPSNAGYYGTRAEIRERLEDFGRALADYDRAVHLDKDRDNVLWLIHRARLYDKLGRWEEAWRDFTRVVERDASVAYLLRERAMVLVHRGDLEGARRELDRVLAAHPELIVCVREKALLCLRMGDIGEALRAIDAVLAALAADPDCRDSFDQYIRGAMLASAGDWPGALTAFDAASAEDPSAELEIRRAQCLLALGRRREALVACDRASKEEPWNERFLLWRARVRRLAGDLRGALADVRRAIERTPDDARFIAEKAVIHATTGRSALARSEARRALRMMRKPQPRPRVYHALLEEYEARGLDLGHAPPVSRDDLLAICSREASL